MAIQSRRPEKGFLDLIIILCSGKVAGANGRYSFQAGVLVARPSCLYGLLPTEGSTCSESSEYICISIDSIAVV